MRWAERAVLHLQIYRQDLAVCNEVSYTSIGIWPISLVYDEEVNNVMVRDAYSIDEEWLAPIFLHK